LQPPVTSSLFGPNILVRALFSNTLSLSVCSCLMSEVKLLYKTTVKITVFYVSIFTFLEIRLKCKIFWTEL
jgi:hypothetical protein